MKKILKIISGIFVIVCAIFAINGILSYVLIDDADDEVRYAMHELYEQENIETLFLGSSHVFCGYDPQILDEALGENTYLASTPVQKVDGSYYLLKEVIKKNNIKKVYLDMYFWQYRDTPAERGSAQMYYIYCITDNMKNNWNRVEFLLNASDCDQYIEGFLPAARYGNYLLDLNRFEQVVKSKRNSEYVNYENIPSNFYKGAMIASGQAGNPKMITTTDEAGIANISENVISEYSLKNLDKIVKLCKEKEIQLVLVTTPFTDFYVQTIGNYDTFYEYMKNYAEVNDIEYYDFNLCKTDILDMESEDFLDFHHLSGKGAAKYSAVFADVMTSYDETERQALFYDSVQEKMNALVPQTMGIFLQKSINEENTYYITTIANYDVDTEYRICSLDEQGTENELIQDFSDNNIIKSSQEQQTTFKITVRDKNTGEICEEGTIKL
ncbi:MAG: hypothetical protein HDR18_10405 [Lachnospiraceae bacterium]|nr:hypothetical protein [Lachnospiraceae bacterium]